MPISQLAFTAENSESFSTGFSICSSSVRFLSGITVLPVSPGDFWVNDRSKQQVDHALNWIAICSPVEVLERPYLLEVDVVDAVFQRHAVDLESARRDHLLFSCHNMP
jgi:hypothetical protein